ncbi:MAG: ATP-binding protein [Lachnospiraceae bacterium]|nr:ATP-binding protein [Lachnospiraceae bacterium]
MFERDLINQLRDWGKKDNHKPLVIRGARQVGKSTLVRAFAEEFDLYIEVNLELSDDADIFQRTDNVKDIWQFLCMRSHVVSDPKKRMLLFIDEIQEEPRAVALLRYFYESMPWLYVIAAGSRLQSLLEKHVSFPVGRVEYLNLRPFSFVEFVNAMEGKSWADVLRNRQVSSLMHERLLKLFNTYALVGGMPEVVAEYARFHDVQRASPLFNSLLKGYNEDVERYAKNQEQVRVIRHILTTAWLSAAECVSFARFGGSNYSSTQVHEAMECLEKANILSLDYPVTSTDAPAIPSLTRSPKLIMLDSGITNFVAGIQLDYLQNADLLDTWRGRAAEQIVAQELRVLLDADYKEKQHYWVRDKKGTKAEIDFVLQFGAGIVPVEVKAGTNSHLKSLHSFVNLSSKFVTAVRCWSGEFFVQDARTPAPDSKPYRLINVPFYYVGQLMHILKENAYAL